MQDGRAIKRYKRRYTVERPLQLFSNPSPYAGFLTARRRIMSLDAVSSIQKKGLPDPMHSGQILVAFFKSEIGFASRLSSLLSNEPQSLLQ